MLAINYLSEEIKMSSLLTEVKNNLHSTFESVYKISSAHLVFHHFRYTGENVFSKIQINDNGGMAKKLHK